jgi:hypothetical protein
LSTVHQSLITASDKSSAALFLEAVSADYAKAITLAKLVGDKGSIMQGLLELGDVKVGLTISCLSRTHPT